MTTVEPPAATGLSLARLLTPVPLERFLRDDWGQAARHVRGSLGARAADLLDLSSFELLLGTLHRAHDGWLHLAAGQRRAVPAALADRDGMLDLVGVRTAFANGDTLYLTKAHRVWPPLLRLCRDVANELHAGGISLREPVSAHVFLTPPGAQGFAAHRDAHGSFVLQLSGRKQWQIYPDRRAPDEPRMAGAADPRALDTTPFTVTLDAGDVLYLPEWWVHSARTSDEHSLHVTLRAFPLRWRDLLADTLPHLAALDQPVTGEDPAAALAAALASVAVRDRLPSLVRRALQRRAVPEHASPGDGLHNVLRAATIDDDTWLTRSDGVSCTVIVDTTTTALAFPGGEVRGPAPVQPMFEHLAAAVRFRPADLAVMAPPGFDRIGLVQRLVVAGVFRPQAGTR